MKNFVQNTDYIFKDEVLIQIYNMAVKKYMKEANNRVVFFDLAKYIKKQLNWKKQSLYTHGLPILKEVCEKIAENFDNSCEFLCPDAKNYRDVYYAVFE